MKIAGIFSKKILMAAGIFPLLAGCAQIQNVLHPVPQEEDISSEDFMADIYKRPDIIRLPSGLAYKIEESGPKDGPHPRKGKNMMLTYEGRLPDGAIFDSSEQHTGAAYMEMPLDGQIKGWLEALPLMHVGDVWTLYVPENLAYGERTMGIIPSHSPLIFKIHLMGVDENDAGEQDDDENDENKSAMTAAEFMEAKYKEPGVIKRPSGLAYKIIHSAPNNPPQPPFGGTVRIAYKGMLPNGTVFDSSDKHSANGIMTMPLGNVIRGWQEAVPLMHVGDRWEIYIPPELGYGEHGTSGIPANSALIFDITLDDIKN